MASETWSQILSTKDARLCGQDEWERASEHNERTGMAFTDRLAGEEEVAWGELGHGFYLRYEYDDTGTGVVVGSKLCETTFDKFLPT